MIICSNKQKLANEIISAIKNKNLDPIKEIHCGIVHQADMGIMDKILTVDFFDRVKNQNWENAQLESASDKQGDLKIVNIIDKGVDND